MSRSDFKPSAASPYSEDQATESRVQVNAGQIFPLLVHAALTNRTWLNDFVDEHLEISEDLYQVLLAYKRLLPASSGEAA